ncbi:U585-like protein, partial [Mya arenaria]
APAADRNKGAILEVLLKYLGNPESFMGNVLEIASGTGQHLGNVQQPLKIDITAPVTSWPGDITAGSYDVIYNANMGLFNFAGYLLKEGGMLITYGPYAENGVLKPDSNVQDPSWGIRDIKDLAELGRKNGITLVDKVEMPANNKTLIWKKTFEDLTLNVRDQALDRVYESAPYTSGK